MVGRISFFVNAGIRFVTELCKMRAFTELWDEICRDRYGVEDAKYRRFRYGVQVNSLGLTEQQPENNVYRILIEMLAVTLSKNARARAVQLPAWNEALGLPRPWDQQWSLRMQQVLAYETDLLEYDDLFDGNPAVERKVEALKDGARAELALIDGMGGAVEAIEYMKGRLVEANAERIARIEAARRWWSASTASPPPNRAPDHRRGCDHGRGPGGRARPDRAAAGLARGARRGAVRAALADLRAAAEGGPTSCRPRSPRRRRARRPANGARWCARPLANTARRPACRARRRTGPRGWSRSARRSMRSARLGRRLKFLVGKPGLDGHSNGAEQIAARARDCGMDIHYEGIRLTPAEIVARACARSAGACRGPVDPVGQPHAADGGGDGADARRGAGRGAGDRRRHHPRGGRRALRAMGVAAVYTPKDFELNRIMMDIVGLVERAPGRRQGATNSIVFDFGDRDGCGHEGLQHSLVILRLLRQRGGRQSQPGNQRGGRKCLGQSHVTSLFLLSRLPAPVARDNGWA
jgi:ethylmalonyl-CoA mutase